MLRKWTGLADIVGQSEAALTGLSEREAVELVSDIWGEYFRCKGCLPTLSIVRTRLALLATTFAVLMTGEDLVRIVAAETRLSEGAESSGITPPCLATAVDG